MQGVPCVFGAKIPQEPSWRLSRRLLWLILKVRGWRPIQDARVCLVGLLRVEECQQDLTELIEITRGDTPENLLFLF